MATSQSPSGYGPNTRSPFAALAEQMTSLANTIAGSTPKPAVNTPLRPTAGTDTPARPAPVEPAPIAPPRTLAKIRVGNSSPVAHSGWVRLTVAGDTLKALEQAGGEGPNWRLGGRFGAGDERAVCDVECKVAGGDETIVSLLDGPVVVRPLVAYHDVFGTDPLRFFGVPMEWVEAPSIDGAAVVGHLRQVVPASGGTFAAGAVVCDVWLRWYPNEHRAYGEALVVYRAPSANGPKTQSVALGGVLRLGGVPLYISGLTGRVELADGQGVAFAFGVRDYAQMVWGLATDARLYPTGNPAPVAVESLPSRTEQRDLAYRRAGTTEPPVLGPAPFSGTTGAQGDQLFRGAEMLADVRRIEIAYMSALKMANRPNNMREIDGRMLSPLDHLDLRLWDGRVHFHAGVSPDRYNGVSLTREEVPGGWWGPDVEHWLLSTLYAAHQVTGSPALRYLLRQQAVIYMLQWTTQPGLSTTQAYAARAAGYEAINAALLCASLPADEAAVVATHFRNRLLNVVLPTYRDRIAQFGWADPRFDDPRIGVGMGILTWQESLLAGALWWVSQPAVAWLVGLLPASAKVVRDFAVDHAVRCVNFGWFLVDGRWKTVAQSTNWEHKVPDESFNYFGMSMALAPAMDAKGEAGPRNDAAVAAGLIFQQLVSSSPSLNDSAWLLPR